MLIKQETATGKNGVRVQSLQIKNFLGIKELEFTPGGKFNFITGRNGAGKTSVLRAIQYAFEGKGRGTQDIDYIYNGEDKAEILIDLGKFQINRRITHSGNYVDVLQDGFKAQSPSNLLKEMVGRFSFNPIEFAFCEEKERNQVVLNALGVEYSTKDAVKDKVYDKDELDQDNNHNNRTGLDLIESLEKRYYAERTEVGRGLESAKKALDELKSQLPEDYAAFDQGAYDKLREAIVNQREIRDKVEEDLGVVSTDKENARSYREELSVILKKYGDEVVHCKYELIEKREEELHKELTKANKSLEDLEAKEDAAREAIKYAKLQGQIESLEERVPKGQKMYDDLTAKIDKLRGEIKTRLIASADIGIEGLAFEEGRFTVKGVAVENLSDSEKLRVGVRIAEKTMGKLDFIFVDGIEKLDPHTLADFLESIKDSQFQYFFTTCHPTGIKGAGVETLEVRKPEEKKGETKKLPLKDKE